MRRKGELMKREYDFSKGVRGKYAARMREGSNIVRIDPDLIGAFPNAESVNAALRELLQRRRRDSAS
jgi:hypothetical protein